MCNTNISKAFTGKKVEIECLQVFLKKKAQIKEGEMEKI